MTPARKVIWSYRLAMFFLLLLALNIFGIFWCFHDPALATDQNARLFYSAGVLLALTLFFSWRADVLYKRLYPTDLYWP